MKIIEPSVTILTPINGIEVLKALELAGRTCYKSEDKITEDSCVKFVQNVLKRGHEAVIEHFNISVRFVCDRGVTHEIVRHRIASYCVTGDTILRGYPACNRFSGKQWTVKQMYDWQSDDKRKSRVDLITTRSVNDNGVVVPNKIERIHYMGEKDTYKVTTESGRVLRCTSDHKILTPNGYVELKNLVAGDNVMANGKELLDNEDWIRNYYITENHTRKETAHEIGCCESVLYKVLLKYGIHKPLSDRPNRHAGHGIKGMFSADARKHISERMSGNGNHRYVCDRSNIAVSTGYGEANNTIAKYACEFCGGFDNLEIHHIDKNPRNNAPGNIKVLCTTCHHAWHHSGSVGVFKDKIVSIDHCGIEPVYDVSMKEPFHNFVASGIVVHNCQESTRYCNYANDKFGREITVIKPNFWDDDSDASNENYLKWESAMKDAEAWYLELLDNGATPQEARSVLPNSLKTEIVMTANLREWRHFLKLRTSPAAHPQMRQIALMLLKQLKEMIPVLFDDIDG